MKSTWFMLSLLICGVELRTSRIESKQAADCIKSEIYKQHYFTLLEKVQDVHLKNRKLFLAIHFDHPSLVFGWNVQGRSGDVQGPMSGRSGLVLKYLVTYGNKEGMWIPLPNPITQQDAFVNRGNLVKPDLVNHVVLKHPIKTKVLRFFPEMWDGSPYMSVRVQFCVEDENKDDASDWKHMKKEEKLVPLKLPINHPLERQTSKRSSGNEANCETGVVWRYDANREIRDSFTSSTGQSTADHVAYSHLDDPYLFHIKSKHEYIQLKFAALSRIYTIKTVGKSEEKDWGGLNQFSLLYKDEKNGKWKSYTDNKNNRRLFDTKGRTKISVLIPEEFKLPKPLDTRILRLYPHEWTGKPYLSLDIEACYLNQPYPSFKECSKSLLSGDNSLVSIKFDNLEKNGKLNNFKIFKRLEVRESALITGVNVRVIRDSEMVKSFVMQYLNTNSQWKNIVDNDGIVKVFHGYSDPEVTEFPDPVETKYIRLYPESWTGNNPTLFVDILGCTEGY